MIYLKHKEIKKKKVQHENSERNQVRIEKTRF